MTDMTDRMGWLAASRPDARAEVERTLYRQCTGRAISDEDIEDVSSDAIRDTFVWLTKQPPGDVDESHLRNSVRLIAKRRALNWYYRRHRRNVLFDEFRGIIQDYLHQRADAEDTLDRLDDVFAFANSVLEPDEIRQIRLKYIENKSHAEIAELFGITPAASRARLSRTIKKLHAQLTEPLEEPVAYRDSLDYMPSEADAEIPQGPVGETQSEEEEETPKDIEEIARLIDRRGDVRAMPKLPSLSRKRAIKLSFEDAQLTILEEVFSLFGRLRRAEP